MLSNMQKEKAKILHIIVNDKFTLSYINFMNKCLSEYMHTFLVPRKGFFDFSEIEDERLVGRDNIIIYSHNFQLFFDCVKYDNHNNFDKIIISGFFGIEHVVCFFPKSIFDKLYIQYWGGDFYVLRNKQPFYKIKDRIILSLKKGIIKKSKAAIFLIEGDADKFREITQISKRKTFIAEMPCDPLDIFPFKEYRKREKNDCIRIVVGNSATEENRHLYALNCLKKYANENIEIFCPLSYGDLEYGKKIALVGKKIFGNKFFPIFDWMNKNDYFVFLSTCDVGVFANDRQQALGNISALLCLGGKVFLNKNTPMYQYFCQKGIKCYDIDMISNLDLEEFIFYPEKDINGSRAESLYSLENIGNHWNTVLNDGD